ncbi:MAG: hypothetical protein ACOX3U_04015 [Christensenellales bacterium]|jgi:hypothetical protein
MGIFQTIKENKAIKQKLFIKKSINNMRRIVKKLDEQKDLYIRKARDAKLKGADTQVNLAVNALKMTIAYQRKAEEMLLNFEIAYQMKDLGAMTAQFFKGISVLSKEMQDIANSNNFLKVQKAFEKAMVGMETQSMNLEVFLDTSQDAFEGVSNEAKGIDDDEILKLLDFEAGESEAKLDTEIDSKLEQVRKAIDEK